jgi:sugar phosphate isomerase/epimerase
MKLGINTGFAVNRFPLHEQWLGVVKDLGLHHVQLTADVLNPSLDRDIIIDGINSVNQLRKKYDITIDSVMTGGFTRVNHFSHPDKRIREYWQNWFRSLADIAVAVDAYDVSSHFGILSYADLHNPENRKHILEETVASWKGLAEYAQSLGLQSLSWEPMSIRREYGETLDETARIQSMLQGSAIPIKICLDVGHGDVASKNPDDTNYLKWIARFGPEIGFVHLKQVMAGSSAHLSFTSENNAKGFVKPEECIAALKKYCPQEPVLLLELAFREREPMDSTVLEQLKQSADYWKKGLRYE